MTPATSAPRRAPRQRRVQPRPSRSSSSHAPRPARPARRSLARYSDPQGLRREVLALDGAGASVLVVDRDIATRTDCRLVAHLGPDEPPQNAAVVCRLYIDASNTRGRCRALAPSDLRVVPFVERAAGCASDIGKTLICARGVAMRLERLDTGMSIPELRWCRRPPESAFARPCSLRDVVAALESYQPACSITAVALALHELDAALSTSVLRSELARVRNSPIVLNRALRERVLHATGNEQLSMSEIALRCRRVKRDAKGNESGETSWLARRLGLLADAGQRKLTPWIHSDVLALIAREGLGISPREVELA